MDEPLNALDVQTSNYLRLELRHIHQELAITTIHITHNHSEAEELADHIAVMNEGKIEQVVNLTRYSFHRRPKLFPILSAH